MPHFLINKNCIEKNKIKIFDKELISHLFQALRVKEGEIIKFITEDEIIYNTKIEAISKKELKGEIINFEKSNRKLGFNLCCLISVLKQEAMHLAVENAVQVGAKEIYTVISDNCALKRNFIIKKSEKWEKIAFESFKQCERADLPKIFEPMDFDEIFKLFKKENILIFAEKNAEYKIKEATDSVDKNEKILAVFGPEGGFSDREFEYFRKNGYKTLTLGDLIYKAPNAITAGLFGITQNV